MITNEGYTHTAYHAIPRERRPEPHPGHAQDREEGPRKVARNVRQTREILAREELGRRLQDMVERLNGKTGGLQTGYHFQVAGSRFPHILMLQGENIVNHFGSGDLMDLERGLYSMSGFQLSVEG
jgi:hypothetical protein